MCVGFNLCLSHIFGKCLTCLSLPYLFSPPVKKGERKKIRERRKGESCCVGGGNLAVILHIVDKVERAFSQIDRGTYRAHGAENLIKTYEYLPCSGRGKKKQTMAPFFVREVECWVWQLLLFLTDGNNASCQFRWRGKSGAKKRHSAVRAGEKRGFCC